MVTPPAKPGKKAGKPPAAPGLPFPGAKMPGKPGGKPAAQPPGKTAGKPGQKKPGKPGS